MFSYKESLNPPSKEEGTTHSGVWSESHTRRSLGCRWDAGRRPALAPGARRARSRPASPSREALDAEAQREPCAPTQPALSRVGLPSAPGELGPLRPQVVSVKTEILAIPLCSQYCFLLTSFLGLPPIFGPDPETWAPLSLTTHHTTSSRDPSPGPACPHCYSP